MGPRSQVTRHTRGRNWCAALAWAEAAGQMISLSTTPGGAQADDVRYADSCRRTGQRESDPADRMVARPASSRATGTRNGEQDT